MEKLKTENKKLSELSSDEAVEAVEKGVKPLAWTKYKVDTGLPYIEFETTMLSIDRNNIITKIFKEKNYIYFLSDKRGDANRIKELAVKMANEQTKNLKIGDVWIPHPPDKEYHIEIGELLGYTGGEIKEFVDKLNL